MSNLYCTTTLPTFAQDVCAVEPSRIISVAFFRTDAAIADYSSASDWQTAIDDGKAVIIPRVRGEEVESTFNEIDGFGTEKSKTVGADHIVNFTLPFTSDSSDPQTDFFNALNYSADRHFAWYTQEGSGFIEADKIVSVKARRVNPTALNDIIRWEVTVEWSNQDLAAEQALPASLFDCD